MQHNGTRAKNMTDRHAQLRIRQIAAFGALAAALLLAGCQSARKISPVSPPAPVASVTVNPIAATVAVGSATQLSVTALDADGHPLSGRTVTWSSDNPAVATVNGSGVVTGVSAASTRILALVDGQSGGSSINVTSGGGGGGGGGSTGGGIVNCPIFPADNIWNRDISALPVHAKSSTWVASIGAAKNFYVGFNPGSFGMRYVLVDGTTPKVSLTFGQDPTHSDPGPYPFGPSTPLEAGTIDAHAFMIDTTTCTLYELYNASWNNGQPRADAGMVFPLNSNALHTDGWSSADEAGLPIFSGLVRRDEVLKGAIKHALRFEAADAHIDGTPGAHLWPARHDHIGGTMDGNLPPMGARFRLKAGYDISHFSPQAQVILLALKHYGMFLADVGYDWELIGTADPAWSQAMLNELMTVPANQFEAVDESSLMISSSSAQSR
jgi:hypothetical protein